MRKYILCAMVFAIVATVKENTSAISSFTYPWIMKTGDTVTTAKWKGNNDTVKAFCDRAADTLNRAVARFSPSSLTHDSVMKYLRLDTIRSEPDVDSLKGLKRIKGKPIMDTIVVDSIATRTLKSSGTILVDSMVSTKKITGNITGNADSARISGTAASATIADSAKGAHHVTTGNVNHVAFVQSDGDIYTSTTYTSVSSSTGWKNSSPAMENYLYVKRVGKNYFVYFSLRDSSNSSACTFQVLDTCNALYPYYTTIHYYDSTEVLSATPGCAVIAGNTKTVTCYTNFADAGWKTSGIKWVYGTLIYTGKD